MGVNYQSYSCRYYKKKFPAVDEVVMVNVRSIAEMGAYVNLLEYENMEGMVLLSELSRRRIRSINKLIKVGKNEAVIVIRVDKDKAYIDLSKRRVAIEDIKRCEDRYIRAKTVISILGNAAEILNIAPGADFENFLERTAWVLDETYKNVGGAYEAFRQSLLDGGILKNCDMTPKETEILSAQIKIRLEPKKVKLRSEIEVACYRFEGIEAVKDSLRQGLKINEKYANLAATTAAATTDTTTDTTTTTTTTTTTNTNTNTNETLSGDDKEIEDDDETNIVKINLIAPPVYVITMATFESEKGLEIMREAIAAVESKIKEYEGHFKVNMQPKVVSEFDDAELARKMADLERVNAEVDGDEDSEESLDEDDEDEEVEFPTDPQPPAPATQEKPEKPENDVVNT